jgi:hypothetical protein
MIVWHSSLFTQTAAYTWIVWFANAFVTINQFFQLKHSFMTQCPNLLCHRFTEASLTLEVAANVFTLSLEFIDDRDSGNTQFY